MNQFKTYFGLVVLILLTGCTSHYGNVGRVQSYSFAPVEAEWIRNGEPIEFEGAVWSPQDEVEILKDSEVLSVSEYREVKVFVDRIDVKPYDRVYTKFDKNQFRAFRKEK